MQRLDLSSGRIRIDEPRWRAFFWPDLSSQPNIDAAIDRGKVISFIVAGLGGAMTIAGILPLVGIVDAALFAALGFGILKKSRICAVLALALYALGIVGTVLKSLLSPGLIIPVIFLSVFVNATRAIFAYHRVEKRSASPTV